MPAPQAAIARALFDPATVALVGASPDERKYSSFPQRFLMRHGFRGTIYPINPGRSEVLGVRAYPSIAAIGVAIDHAFIMLPTPLVEAAVTDCAAAGVGCVTILSNGFAEAGPAGKVAQDRLVAIAGAAGMRLLGPNSMGVVNMHAGIALSCNEVLTLPALAPGQYALVSQSGSLLGAILSRGHARGIGFSKLVSVGNEADLDLAAIIDMLVDDPHTGAILTVLETIRQPDAFARAMVRAHAAGKPVLALRLGGSAVGRSLAQSHTGALIGSGAALDAFLRDTGVARVAQMEALLEAAPLFVGRRPAERRRFTAVTTTGGGGSLVVDALAAHGIEAVPPDADTITSLAARGIEITASPLIDLTLTGTNPETYGGVLNALRQSPANDLVLAVVGSSSQFRPDRAVAPIVAAHAADPARPIVAFFTPAADESLGRLRAAGIAAFRTPESCADAVRAFFGWQAPRVGERSPPPPPRVAALIGAATEATLSPGEARGVFDALGIPGPATALLPPDPARWSDTALNAVPFPVAAKIVSRDIQHKTEAGGVRLDIGSPAALARAGCEILESAARYRPGARVEGIQVETMERGLAQVLVGFTRDPSVGPTVTLAVGGVLAELYRDAAVRIAPIDLATAHTMIGEVRGLAVLTGYRNLPRGDVVALAQALVALGSLALLDGTATIAEAEINPLIVRSEGAGVVAVDALIVRAD